MRARNRSPSPQRRMRRTSGADTCCSERSKYGHAGGEHRVDEPRRELGRVEVEQPHPRARGRPPPPPAGRSPWCPRPGRARSWRGPGRPARSPARRSAASSSTSARICSIDRERCGPRKLGMAQKPHALSQPSATFTYAHGAAAGGRGRFSRSKLGSGGRPGLRPRVTGTPKPATASTSGSASASSAP